MPLYWYNERAVRQRALVSFYEYLCTPPWKLVKGGIAELARLGAGNKDRSSH